MATVKPTRKVRLHVRLHTIKSQLLRDTGL